MSEDPTSDTFAKTILDLFKRIEHLLSWRSLPDEPRSRILIALAGVPGSGKSTLSHALLTKLRSRHVHNVAVVPMDGFHYTKAVLATFADPERALLRRGAPSTFDAQAFVDLVKKIKAMPITTSDEIEQFIYAPSFDHATKDPIQDAIPVSSRNRLIIIEGNYTLLNQNPWNEIAGICEEKWFVDTSADIAKERLVQRHLMAGIETSAAAAAAQVAENDLRNGDLIRSLLIEPDVNIQN